MLGGIDMGFRVYWLHAYKDGCPYAYHLGKNSIKEAEKKKNRLVKLHKLENPKITSEWVY